jgi:hypothetical protein
VSATDVGTTHPGETLMSPQPLVERHGLDLQYG